MNNITSITTINYELQGFSSVQVFEYDSADQLINAVGNDSNLYSLSMTYGNYGRINTSNTSFTDPQTSVTQVFSNNYTYNTANAPSNSFAPTSANNNSIQFEFGINGSLRKRLDTNKIEYYHFNAFDQMKAYSDNGETYGYYGYDDAGQRTYKMVLNNFVSRTNAFGNKILEVEKMMLYPNGYININQNGEYTKHYYADAQRIASKIGNGYSDTINVNTTDTVPLYVMKTELSSLTGDTIDDIVHSFEQITHLQGDTSNNKEDALFFYHGNHLSSTQLITNNIGDIAQAILYAPFGQVISEYKQDWMIDTIPRYLFTGMERDEESGMDYMNARYYSSDGLTFISPDPLFEQKPWMSKYAYCSNNPINRIDPTGMLDGDFRDENGKYLGNDGETDDNVYFVNGKSTYATEIRNNQKDGKSTDVKNDQILLSTTYDVLNEAVNVYGKAEEDVKKGKDREHASVQDNEGKWHKRVGENETGSVNIPVPKEGRWKVSIHSHRLNRTKSLWYSPDSPSGIKTDIDGEGDIDVFKHFELNIIVGKLPGVYDNNFGGWIFRNPMMYFYRNNGEEEAFFKLSIDDIKKNTISNGKIIGR